MIITLAARAFQALFSIVVLGLSIALLKGWGPLYSNTNIEDGHPPALHGYGAFCGGAGLLVAIVGIVSCFFEVLQGLIMLALDGFACLFVVAGGIAFAVKTGVGNCDDKSSFGYLSKHTGIFLASLNKNYDDTIGSKTYLKNFENDVSGRCRMVQAETAFLWFMFATFLVTVGLTFFTRSGKRTGAMV